MTNQVRCERLPEDHVVFGTNGPESHLFGLEPNFGCCTANFGQGWPKFASSLFMKSEKGIASAVLAPGKVTTTINKVKVTCSLETNYPFEDRLTYLVLTESPVEFELMIRIPGSAKAATVNGQSVKTGEFVRIQKTWTGNETVLVELEQEAKIHHRPKNMGVLWRGSLLYSIAIGEQWKKHEYTSNDVERKFPYCDYEVIPTSDWNFGFNDNNFVFQQNKIGPYVFSNEPAPVQIMAKLTPIDWREEHSVCTAEPVSRVPIGVPRLIKMIPYGCAKLRMTEIPIIT
jgi:hypothetical protein